MSEMTGMMHCWLAAKADLQPEFGGDAVPYVCLRTINLESDFHRTHDFSVDFVWEHVPTVKFNYGAENTIPTVDETLVKVASLVAIEWPALQNVRIVGADQDVTGRLGGKTQDGRIEAATRIALDFGTVSALPEVKMNPGQTLPFPRHPVDWIRADTVTATSLKDRPEIAPVLAMEDGDTVYVVAGNRTIDMEARSESGIVTKQTTLPDLPLQGTVARRFLDSFGPLFHNAPQAEAAAKRDRYAAFGKRNVVFDYITPKP